MKDNEEAKGIFVNEDLTRTRSRMAFIGSQVKRDKKINDSWNYDGKIFIKNGKNKVMVYTSTVFYQIHAPVRTPKNPEGRLYSGLIIRSKSERSRAASGIPELAVSFLIRANQAVMCTQITEIKWLLVVLDL